MIVRSFGAVLCGLLILNGLVVLLTRSLQQTRFETRLRACIMPCDWAHLNLDGLTIGDVVAALGAPHAVSFVEISSNRPPSGVHFQEVLHYPALKLRVYVENIGGALHLSPGSYEKPDLEFDIGVSLPTLQWRGFASLCRYYPLLPGLCANF